MRHNREGRLWVNWKIKLSEDLLFLNYVTNLMKSNEAKKFNDSLISVLKPYRAKLKKMHKILERKQNWENFSQKEKSVVENAILLAQLLCHMCSINLIKDATTEHPIERVNTPEISRAIADAKNVLKEVA